MNSKSNRLFPGAVFFIIIFTFPEQVITGQQASSYPVSYRIFDTFIFNPAIAGSKDFFSLDLIGGKIDKSNSQIVCGSTRLTKSGDVYFEYPYLREFTRIGLGGYLFNETYDLYHNKGISGAISYHVQLDNNALSFISFGISGKAVYHEYKGEPDLNRRFMNEFYTDLNFGIFYYSPSLFAGISALNLAGSSYKNDSTNFSTIGISRQYFFEIGYKQIISKSLNIVVEPSVIVNTDDSFSGKILDMIEPLLKIYAGSFCMGTYFHDFDNYSFFLQYKYPKFHLGAYFELPKGEPLYRSPILAELMLGINISAIRNGSIGYNHW